MIEVEVVGFTPEGGAVVRLPNGSIITMNKNQLIEHTVSSDLLAHALKVVGQVAARALAQTAQEQLPYGPRTAPEPAPVVQDLQDPPQASSQQAAVQAVIEKYGLQQKVDTAKLPFTLNDANSRDGNALTINDGRELQAIYNAQPELRNKIAKRLSEINRLSLLDMHDVLSEELRKHIVAYISMRNTERRSNAISPDLTAFLRNEPLRDTIGRSDWNPATELGSKSNATSSEFRKSQAFLEQLAAEHGDEIAAELYKTTEDMGHIVERAKTAQYEVDPNG